mmetsp:Transcript_28695/g.38262  ORF Transcript_28695/g.38262 Transcript_28695/m.38262 type:complete len:90 (-) Transcript_28695:1924-2193(-)
MLDKKQVFVEEDGEEVNIRAANLMGPDNAISQKQLKEMQDRVKQLTMQNDELKRDWVTKETTLKSLNDQVRDEKTRVERKLYETEFMVG